MSGMSTVDGGSSTKYVPFQPHGPVWFGLGANVETLSATKTLAWTDKQVQILDPGGADRTVTLPAEGTSGTRDGGFFDIKSSDSASAGETLTVQNDASTTIVTLEAGDSARVFLEAGTWYAVSVCRNMPYGLYKQQTTISSAQLLALNATPITVVAAPGAGKVAVPVLIHAWLDFESAAHSTPGTGEDLDFRYTDATGEEIASIEATSFLDATADEHRIAPLAYAALDAPGTIEPVANAVIVAHLSGGELGGSGDSPLKIEVLYRIIDLTW